MDELDRILTSEEILTPSSGFPARVMEAVQDAAAEPSPLPFPWGRLAAGVIASIVSGAASVALVMRLEVPAASAVTPQLSLATSELGYAAVAVFASLGALQASRLLSAREP